MTASLEVDPATRLDEVRDDWIRLADAAGNPFSTWEWASIWWRHFGRDREPVVVRLRDSGGEVRAVVPLYVSATRPARMLRLVGHGPADQLGPVCAPGDAQAALEAVRGELERGLAGCQLALLERLPGERGLSAAFGGRVVITEPSPILEHDGDFDSFLAARSRNFREQVRRRERRLSRDHGVEFALTTSPDTLDEDYTTLVDLHRRRWGEDSRAFDPPRDRFHREFAAAALERGWLRLWTLKLDGRPVAAWLGYRMGGAEWYYQAGRDPALEREAVGFVLMAHTVRSALDDGIHRYRLLLGGEAYKDRFATADYGLDTTALGLGLRGRAVVAAARAAAASPPVLRRRLRRFAA